MQRPPEARDGQPDEADDVGGYQEPRRLAACILGGAQAPRSNRHLKQLARGVNAVLHEPEAARPLKWSHHSITFSKQDRPSTTRMVGLVPLVCTPTVNNVAVSRTLIDGGAGLNVLSIAMFDQMQVP